MIGYWLAEDQQGNGVMTRACRALVSYGFDTLQLHRVEIRCATGNERSCAIPKRLGFEHEGILREAEWLYDHYVDLHLFSILAQQWTMSTLKSSTHELR
jgi:ribosomal-protein-serine acetyltransferase